MKRRQNRIFSKLLFSSRYFDWIIIKSFWSVAYICISMWKKRKGFVVRHQKAVEKKTFFLVAVNFAQTRSVVAFQYKFTRTKKNLYIPLEKIFYATKQWCNCVTLDLKYI